MYVIEWGSSERGDKTGRSCSFLEMNEQKLWYMVRFGLLLIFSTFPCTFWHRRTLLGLRKSGCFGGHFWRQKSALLSAFTSRSTKWLRQVVLFFIVDECGKYFCSVRWNGRDLNFYPLTLARILSQSDGYWPQVLVHLRFCFFLLKAHRSLYFPSYFHVKILLLLSSPSSDILLGLLLRQDPLEAILVIFGRRALIFFVWKLLKKMKNDTIFVRMRSGDHLGDAKMSKKGTSLRRI